MTPTEAAQLLELPATATPEQVEARFLELRRKLEDKIAKAPTPGLQAKYRESLAEITTAFETLTLAADASALPVLQRQSAKGEEPGAGAAATPPREPEAANPKSKIQNRKSGTEFLIVAVIAIAVLGAGGWWVLKTRADNAEKARLAAEAKAETERLAREQAAAEKLAREKAETERLAREAAEKAERERQDRLITQLRSRLAELNVSYDAIMRTETIAEREFAELKALERELGREQKNAGTPEARLLAARISAHERFVAWLRDTLPVHPARVARARLEELLSARAADDAAAALEAYAAASGQLKHEVAAARQQTEVTGTAELNANIAGARVEVTDAFGVRHTGTVPVLLTGVAFGPAEVIFHAPGYAPLAQRIQVGPGAPGQAVAEFRSVRLEFEFDPAAAVAEPLDVTGLVVIEPGRVFEFPPGLVSFRITAPDHAPRRLALDLSEPGPVRHRVALGQGPLARLKFEVTEGVVGATDSALASLAEGFQESGGYASFVAQFAAMFADTDDREGFVFLAEHLQRRRPRLALSEDGLRGALAGYVPAYGLADDRQRPRPDSPPWVEEYLSGSASAQARAPLYRALRNVIELVIAGRDPAEAGLSESELNQQTNFIVSRLAARGRPDLAEAWLGRWHANRAGTAVSSDSTGLFLAAQIMKEWIRQGDAPRALALFRRYQEYHLSFDRNPGYGFAPRQFTRLIAAAGVHGDREGIGQLAGFVAGLQALPVPAGSANEAADWFWMWENTLRRAGRGDAAHEARMLEEIRPASPAPATSAASRRDDLRGGLLGSLAGAVRSENESLGIMARLAIARSLAKRRAARGEHEAAFQAAALTQTGAADSCAELGFTYASLGDLTRALDAFSRARRPPYSPYADSMDAATRQQVASIDRVYARTAAIVYGEALAEKEEEGRALRALSAVADPMLQLLAKAAYVSRRHRLEQLTPAQREVVRSLPPL